MRYVAAWVATLVAFVVLDVMWLMFYAGALFKTHLGALLRAQPDLVPAAVLDLVYATGLAVLVVAPAIVARSLSSAIWRGAVLGLTAYAMFDLTNLAVLQGWTLPIALLDMAWGTFASSTAAAAGFVAAKLTRPLSRRDGHAPDAA